MDLVLSKLTNLGKKNSPSWKSSIFAFEWVFECKVVYFQIWWTHSIEMPVVLLSIGCLVCKGHIRNFWISSGAQALFKLLVHVDTVEYVGAYSFNALCNLSLISDAKKNCKRKDFMTERISVVFILSTHKFGVQLFHKGRVDN